MWYDVENEERVKEYMSKYSIADFWKWWTNNCSQVMEVRIKDFILIKKVAQLLSLRYSASGVYVKSVHELKEVIMLVRSQATVWFGVNPRREAYNKFGRIEYGGRDVNIQDVRHIFIDIDRVVKNGPASCQELKACDTLAENVLEHFRKNNWGDSYLKICSGNGVQLLIKLDVPILVPKLIYDTTMRAYNPDQEFERVKSLLQKGIGKELSKYGERFRAELGVEIDSTGFNIGRVAALPFTKNYKYDGFTWRGIVEMKHTGGRFNYGLSDYLTTADKKTSTYRARQMFSAKIGLEDSNRLRPCSLREHKLTRLLLEHDFPEGGINNTLWFQFKILVRDSGIDRESQEYRELHEELKRKHRRAFADNVPEERFQFHASTVNRYCLKHLLPPIYPLTRRGQKIDNKYCDAIGKEALIQSAFQSEEPEPLSSDTDIVEDCDSLKKKLVPGDYRNIQTIKKFIKSCVNKYGEAAVEYYNKYVFDSLINYS